MRAINCSAMPANGRYCIDVRRPKTRWSCSSSVCSRRAAEPCLLQDFLRNPVDTSSPSASRCISKPPKRHSRTKSLSSWTRCSDIRLSDSLLQAALRPPENVSNRSLLKPAFAKQRTSAHGRFWCMSAGELIEPLPDLLQRYQQLLTCWPTPLTQCDPGRLSACRAYGLKVGSGLASDVPTGRVSQITTIPNSIGSIKRPQMASTDQALG